MGEYSDFGLPVVFDEAAIDRRRAALQASLEQSQMHAWCKVLGIDPNAGDKPEERAAVSLSERRLTTKISLETIYGNASPETQAAISDAIALAMNEEDDPCAGHKMTDSRDRCMICGATYEDVVDNNVSRCEPRRMADETKLAGDFNHDDAELEELHARIDVLEAKNKYMIDRNLLLHDELARADRWIVESRSQTGQLLDSIADLIRRNERLTGENLQLRDELARAKARIDAMPLSLNPPETRDAGVIRAIRQSK